METRPVGAQTTQPAIAAPHQAYKKTAALCAEVAVREERNSWEKSQTNARRETAPTHGPTTARDASQMTCLSATTTALLKAAANPAARKTQEPQVKLTWI